MPTTAYQSALVTGASSGIGAATVAALRERGLTVFAVARRQDRLDQLARDTGCEPIAIDLRDSKALYAGLGGLEVDILINNAGTGRGLGQALFEVDPKDIDNTTETNVLAALHVIRAVVPGMVTRKRGHIINVGSVAGLYPLASSLYGASKGAMHLLSQNLRVELKGTGIRVTELCPGRVATEIFENAVDDPKVIDAMIGGFQIMTSEDIAAAIIYALDAPWHVNISMIELVATEQHIGGVHITPVT